MSGASPHELFAFNLTMKKYLFFRTPNAHFHFDSANAFTAFSRRHARVGKCAFAPRRVLAKSFPFSALPY